MVVSFQVHALSDATKAVRYPGVIVAEELSIQLQRLAGHDL
jgi:hypothetical protein